MPRCSPLRKSPQKGCQGKKKRISPNKVKKSPPKRVSPCGNTGYSPRVLLQKLTSDNYMKVLQRVNVKTLQNLLKKLEIHGPYERADGKKLTRLELCDLIGNTIAQNMTFDSSRAFLTEYDEGYLSPKGFERQSKRYDNQVERPVAFEFMFAIVDGQNKLNNQQLQFVFNQLQSFQNDRFLKFAIDEVLPFQNYGFPPNSRWIMIQGRAASPEWVTQLMGSLNSLPLPLQAMIRPESFSARVSGQKFKIDSNNQIVPVS